MSEDDNFAGRVRRYARVSGAVGGLAARLAGERYLGIGGTAALLDQQQHRLWVERLRAIFPARTRQAG